jgi:Spy/CpxP family protein refolding chaperone
MTDEHGVPCPGVPSTTGSGRMTHHNQNSVRHRVFGVKESTAATRGGKRAMKAIQPISLMVVVVALLAFSMPAPAFSQMMDMPMKEQKAGPGQMMKMDKMGDMMGMCLENAEKIGLTDDQLMKMKAIHRAMQKKQAQFKADLKIAKIDLMEIMEVKDFNLDKANSAVKKMADIKTAHELEKLKSKQEMHKMLTEEQFKKMKKMMMSMKMGE